MHMFRLRRERACDQCHASRMATASYRPHFSMLSQHCRLWDPLNMLRTLINYGQLHTDMEKEIAMATVAHMTEESKLLKTDPVYVVCPLPPPP
jgi:hypothetical protein